MLCSSPAAKRNPFTERQAGLRLNPFHVATYYLRSLSDAAKAEGTIKVQKYKFLSNYFKDLPADLESLLFEIRDRVVLTHCQSLLAELVCAAINRTSSG